MQKKLDFIKDVLSGNYSIAELARRYTISRKTAYKYIDRYHREGEKGLHELSRAPHKHPNSTPEKVIKEIVNTKLSYKAWGPKKIVAKLKHDHPDRKYPSPSTAQHWLSTCGLVEPRKRKPHVPPYSQPFSECNASNAVWSIDFKGEFRMGNRQYCYPLTLEDNFSRFLILCVGLDGTKYLDTHQRLQWAFQEYGMPLAIRSDNGTPFVAPGQTGLSRISIWLIQLGILHERIDKGHPEQNGRLERFHRTLKDFVKAHPQADLGPQQQLFDAFRYEYNHVRPHESLGFQRPAELFSCSTRQYPARISPPEYGPDFEVRKVKNRGEIALDWRSYYVCQLLSGEYVGLKYRDTGVVDVYYYNQQILNIDLNRGKIHGKQRRIQHSASLDKQAAHQPWKRGACEGELRPTRYARRAQLPLANQKKLAKNEAI
jgi:transposase InsO family protein